MKIKWYSKLSSAERAAIIGGILAIVGALIAAIISVGQFGNTSSSNDSAVKLVDLAFIESSQFPKLDVKVRNTGTKIAFLKRAEFQVRKIWILRPPLLPNAVNASWDYDVLLPIADSAYTVSQNISQSIDPNGVDRFTFTLGNNAHPGVEDYVFLMTLKLVYDEDNKVVTSENLMFASKGAGEVVSTYSPGGKFRKSLTIQNKLAISQIDSIGGTKSKYVQMLISEISKISIKED